MTAPLNSAQKGAIASTPRYVSDAALVRNAGDVLREDHHYLYSLHCLVDLRESVSAMPTETSMMTVMGTTAPPPSPTQNVIVVEEPVAHPGQRLGKSAKSIKMRPQCL